MKADDTVENLLETTKLSLYTLFTVPEQHNDLSLSDANQLLAYATDVAVNLVSQPAIIGEVMSRIELFVTYDCLL